MKKKLVTFIIVVSVLAAFMQTSTRAAITPYFMAVNDTLLPFNDDTMPYISGNQIFVPYAMFKGASVNAIASEDLEWVRLYRGPDRYVDFFTGDRITQDKEGNILNWPPARRIGSRFYVPLDQVCEYFGLRREIIDINREIIPQEQMRVIRITSVTDGLNGLTFVGLNRNAIRAAYNEYYAPPSPPPPTPTTSPGLPTPTPTPTEEPPPTYRDVTIYISFHGLSSEGVEVLQELLDSNDAYNYRFCFFASAADIRNDPELIRRISGIGHMIGIWLDEGTLEEYAATSALLFEAAKIRTLLVSSGEFSARAALIGSGLIFWGPAQSLLYDDTFSLEEVTEMLSKESGAKQNLMSDCSVNTVLMLSGILSHLREYEYTIESITETVPPIRVEGRGHRYGG